VYRSKSSNFLVKASIVSSLVVILFIILSLTAQNIAGLDLQETLEARLGDVGGLTARAELAEGALSAFADQPFLGVGRSNLIRYSGYPSGHSFYLTRLGEDGAIGFLLALAAIWALWDATKPDRIVHLTSPEVRGMVIGLRGAFASVPIAFMITSSASR
jgi:O-antigen ligase